MSDDLRPQSEAALFIQRLESGQIPHEFLLHAARGLLPFEVEEMVGVLAFLTESGREEVARTAKQTLRELPPRAVLAFARSATSDPHHLRLLSHATEEPAVLEAILRNRATDDQTMIELAAKAGPNLQEVIVVNQERMIRSPAILEALLSNPAVTADTRRRALEIREEFFEKRKPDAARADGPAEAVDEEPLSAEQEEELARLLALAEAAGEEEAASAPPPPVEGADEELSVWNRILKMTVAEKVQCAFKGGRTERSILVRERNRLVCAAVIRSPRVTDSEIEAFAGMRNIEEEALRLIGSNREYVRKYPIILNLVRNPKAPIGVVLPLINRLTLRDLKSLSSDKGVSEAVRQSARKLYIARRQQ